MIYQCLQKAVLVPPKPNINLGKLKVLKAVQISYFYATCPEQNNPDLILNFNFLKVKCRRTEHEESLA